MNNYINSKHHLAEPCGNTMNTKEPAVIEQAINRLKAVVTENRILSHEIADNVFHDRGVGANSPEPVVLPGIIDDISNKIVQTNDLLSEIKNCLKGQLGEIKLG